MPAAAGSPFRGCASIRIFQTDIPDAEKHRFTAYIDAGFGTGTPGDNTTWEGTPGSTLTLRAKWEEIAGGTADPTRFDVQVRLPGGAQVGATWNVPLAVGVEQTRTLRFDSDPLDNDVSDAIRAGTLEIFIEVQAVGGIDEWGPFDSRGRQTDPPLGFSAASSSWAQGYLRSRSALSAFAISNIALGGAEPATFAYPDPTHTRATVNSAFYRTGDVFTVQHRNGATTIRSGTDTIDTAETEMDVSFTANSGATSRVHNVGSGSGGAYPNGTAGVRLVLPSRDFGGDNEYAWAASGHLAGWSVVDTTTLEDADRITVNPTLTFTQHLQLNDPVFGVAKRITPAVRLESQQGNIWARLTNSRGAGVNLPGDINGGRMEFNFRDPFGTVRDTHIDGTSTQDGEAGWIDTSLLWDQALPGGTWVLDVEVEDAAGVQGTTAQTFILLAIDVQAVVGACVSGSPSGFQAGETLGVNVALIRADNGNRIAASSADVALVKFTSENGQMHYNGTDWVPTGAGSVTWIPLTLHPVDGISFRGEFTDTAEWGFDDFTIIGRGLIAGSAFADHVRVELTGKVFDPTGLFS